MVVCGSVVDGGKKRYLDEFSTLGDNEVVDFPQDMTSILSRGIPFQPATLADLAGADRQTNAEIVRRLLHGEERGPKRDAILLNSAAAMIVAGKCRSFADGWDMAAELIDSGKTMIKLKELIEAA